MDEGFFGDDLRPRESNHNNLYHVAANIDLEGAMINFGDYINGDRSPPSSPSASSEENDSDNELPAPENQVAPPIPDVAIGNEAQFQMAFQVLEALMFGKNLVIECPQRRERTLTVLKKVLQYFQWKNRQMQMEDADSFMNAPAPKPKRIYVVTRNFKESKKLLQEMQDDLFASSQLLWNIQMSVLDHRKNYCVNEDVMSNATDNASVDHACRNMLRSIMNQNIPSSSKRAREDGVACEYFRTSSNLPDAAIPFVHPAPFALAGDERMMRMRNIEDLIEEGRLAVRCSYYDSKHLAQRADLIFVPADIFLSPYFRQEYGIDLEQVIVFFVEAFDLENLCKEQASVDISWHELNQACQTMRDINENYQRRIQNDIGLIDLVNFLPLLSRCVARHDERNNERPDPEEVLNVIRELNVDALNIPAVTQKILDFGENAPVGTDIGVGVIDKLRKLVTVLLLMSRNNEDGIQRFRVQVKTRESRANPSYDEVFLQISCADPCVIMTPIEDSVNSIVLGSSCIAPYSPFYTEFGGIFTEDRTLKIEHDGMMMGRYLIEYTSKGPSGAKFALGFDARDEPAVKNEVLAAILELCKVIPQNVICFFHSGDYLRRVRRFSKTTSFVPNGSLIEDEIAAEKRIFCETDATSDTEAQELMHNFHEAGRTEPGAVLFALHRGKFCKNYDLEHESVRGIIHISIPFGPWYHHQDIAAKRKYFESKIGEINCIENKEWYHCEAFRILNQSFNYCVRRRQDWGVVVVLDSRMHGERHKFEDMVPLWARRGDFPKRQKEFSALISSVETKVREWTGREGN